MFAKIQGEEESSEAERFSQGCLVFHRVHIHPSYTRHEGHFRNSYVSGLLMFFDNWMGILRVLVGGAYATLVVFLRVSGKRTLAKLNAFDLVITVSLGSTLASIICRNP